MFTVQTALISSACIDNIQQSLQTRSNHNWAGLNRARFKTSVFLSTLHRIILEKLEVSVIFTPIADIHSADVYSESRLGTFMPTSKSCVDTPSLHWVLRKTLQKPTRKLFFLKTTKKRTLLQCNLAMIPEIYWCFFLMSP